MIYLLAGGTHTGKTHFALDLVRRHPMLSLSIDHLKMGLIRSKTIDLRVDQDAQLTEVLWPITREIIRTAIENEQHLIVEGCCIPATWADDLTDAKRSHIHCLFLLFSARYLDAHREAMQAHACCIEQRADDAIDWAELLRDNRRLLAEVKRAGASYLLIDEAYPDEKTLLAAIRQA